MKRPDVTLVVEEDLLLETGATAAQHECRRKEAFERIQHLLEQPKVHFGGALRSRDELHER